MHRLRLLSSLRARLILLVLCALVPAMVILFLNAAERREREAGRARADVLTLSQLAASQQEQVLENVRQVLVSLAELPEVRGDDPTACMTKLAELLAQYEGYTGFAVARPNGDLFCRTTPLTEPVNVANSTSFQQALANHDLGVGEYQVGRASGKPTLGLCYPVLDDGGDPQAVICGGVDLTRLNQVAAEFQLDPELSLVVVDRSGTIPVRYPDPQVWVGKNLSDDPLIQAMQRHSEAELEVTGPDGINRLYAFTPVRSSANVDTGIALAVGVPIQLAYADVNRQLLRDLGLMGGVALLTLALVWWGSEAFVLRQVKALVGAAGRLSRGDLHARAGFPQDGGEISQLGQSFDSMAVALEQREAERQKAEHALREQQEWLRVTLASIGDAVIATDMQGRVSFMNPIAQSLTGWSQTEAAGRPLSEVFHIINAHTRTTVADPVGQVIGSEAIVGLANHTLLIARDGRETPIDDSGAPIQDSQGAMVGVVLTFRDVTEREKAEEALRLSRNQLAIILRGAADGITAQDRTGQLRFANDAAARVIGYASADELLEAPLTQVMQRFEMYDEAGQPFPLDQLPGRLALQGEPFASAIIRYRLRATGEEHWSLTKATPVLDVDGNVELAINIFQDITDLKRTELAQRLLAETGRLLAAPLDYEDRLANVARLAVPWMADWCAIDMWDTDGTIRRVAVAHVDPARVEWAQKLHRRYPSDANEPRGVAYVLRTGESEFYPLVPESVLEAGARDAEHLKLIRMLGLKSAMVVPLVAYGRTLGALTMVWAESGRRYSQADLALAEELARRAALAVDNARLYARTQQLNAELEQRIAERTAQLQASNAQLMNEIGERHDALRRLEESQTQLRHLSAHLQAAREEERTRIARELHDELGQTLTALKIEVAWVQRSLKDETPGVRQKLQGMSQLIDSTIQLIRHIATELRPGILDDLGLAAAIEWQLTEFQSRTGIECELTSRLEEDTALGRDGKTAIFRIFQETLTNVARHANATEVVVNLEENPEYLMLQVQDNGRGITPGDITKSRSFGLLGMRERVNLLNGELTLQGVPGQGTKVVVRVPIGQGPQPDLSGAAGEKRRYFPGQL